MNWIFRRAPLNRQTCRHAAEKVSAVPTIASTKDGRWIITMPMGAKNEAEIVEFLAAQGMPVDLEDSTGAEGGRNIPGSSAVSSRTARLTDQVARPRPQAHLRLAPAGRGPARRRRRSCLAAQAGRERRDRPRISGRRALRQQSVHLVGRCSFTPRGSTTSTEPHWTVGRRAPLLGEDTVAIRAELAKEDDEPLRSSLSAAPRVETAPLSPHGKPFPLSGVRIFDFSWFLASAGGTRFLTALGAECIKVEWAAHPDTRIAAMAPVGGRAARDADQC